MTPKNPSLINSIESLIQQCEQEPLHLSGAIQNRGALLRTDLNGVVTHFSANLATLTGLSASDVQGKPLPELFCLKQNLNQALSAEAGATLFVSARENPSGTGPLDIRCVRDAAGGLLFEIEPHASSPQINLHTLRKPFIHGRQERVQQEKISAALIAAFRTLTGCDRIMIYRFHEDWSGEVIAEHTAMDFDSYLGLRFPASDIPAIARRLYLLNPCRYIHDVTEPAIPILGHASGCANEPAIDEPAIDLSLTDLRSVSPVHLTYLANMKVGMSFSVPLRVAGQLWGLVACHHGSSKLLTMAVRESCVSLARSYSILLSMLLAETRMQLVEKITLATEILVSDISRSPHFIDNLRANTEKLQSFLNAAGLVGFFDRAVILERAAISEKAGTSDYFCDGQAPSSDEMQCIDLWFTKLDKPIFTTDHLSKFLPEFAGCTAASGLAALQVKTTQGSFRLYWFRKAEPSEVNWAGNPLKQIDESFKSGASPVLTPRRSFEKWVEVRSGFSAPWSDSDRAKLAQLRNAFAHVLVPN